MGDELIAENTPSTGDVNTSAETPTTAVDKGTVPAVKSQEPQSTEGQPAATDNKTVEGAKAEGEQGGITAPENYEFKLPEGVEVDAEVMGELSSIAKDLKLSQEDAQKFADLGPKLLDKWSKTQNESIQKAQGEWIEATKTDKEFGGDKMGENIAVARKAFAAFGTPALDKLLNDTGLGNHPEIIRAFYRAGKAINEDKHVAGGGATAERKAAANILYPNQK